LNDGIGLVDLFKPQDVLCGYCRSALKVLRKTVNVLDFQVYAFYEYDPIFEKMIFQVKESKDVALAPSFLYPYRVWLKKKIQDKTVILVPSSAKKTKQRGFDVLSTLYADLGCELLSPFEKDDVKQSQRTWTQRSKIKRHVRLVHPEMIQGKDLVLLDDVCTTGFTLKACLDLVRPYARSVEVLVLACHPDNLKTRSPNIER